MRKFLILEWPFDTEEFTPDLSKPWPLLKEFDDFLCLDVDGRRVYFYHNQNKVKEVTDEGNQ